MLETYFPECKKVSCPLRLSCGRSPTVVQRSPFAKETDPIDILFVSDHPNSREMKSRRPFSGPEKDIIHRIVTGVDEELSYAFTYLIRGWPVDTTTVPGKHKNQNLTVCSEFELSRMRNKSFGTHPGKKEIIDKCQDFLIQDMEKLKPKLVVVMGKIVKEALFPQEYKTVTRLTDSFRSFHGVTTRFTTTPKSLVQNPSGKKQWEQQLEAIVTGKTAQPDTKPGEDILITDIDDALDYIDMIKHSEVPISVDLETLNLNKTYGNKIATIQFAETTTLGVTIPYHHPETPFTPDELEKIREALYDLFHEPNNIPYWIGQNLKFECNLLHAHIGTQILSAPIFDTQIAAFLVDENRRERVAEFRYGIYTLKQLAYDYCNFDGYDKGVLAQRSAGSLFDLELKKLSQYGAMDVYITLRLHNALIDEAINQDYEDDLMNLMFTFYTPMTRLFCDVEQNGFYVNREHLRGLISKTSSPLLTEMKKIETTFKESFIGKKTNALLLHPGRIAPLGGMPWVFNFAKGGHAQKLFFDVLRLPKGKVGVSGVASVDSAWQKENIKNEYVTMFSEWQGYRILYNTFATKLYARVDPRKDDVDCNTDTRIRPNFILTGPVTGRLACRNPNLQNIPRGDTEGKKAVKNIFQAPPGHFLVQLDYKANEVRWVGIMAKDENLAKAINEGRALFVKYRENPTPEALEEAETYGDLHKQTASLLFNKDVKDVTKNERQAAKAVVFAILYGSSVKSVAEGNQKTVEEVQAWFDQFYARFPKIAGWKAGMEASATRRGYVETPNGRRRRFPLFDMYRDAHGVFKEDDPRIGEAQGKIAECLRQAVNSPIQGVASDAGMLGAALFANYIREHKKPWLLSNAVHDSCVYVVPYDELEESLRVAEDYFTDKVMSYMTEHYGIHFNLPLEIEFELGLKWGDLTKWNYAPEHLVELSSKFLDERGEL